MKLWKLEMLWQTLGHFDIKCQIVHITNSLLAQSRWNRMHLRCARIATLRPHCGIPTMFNCFSSTRLTEIADNGAFACFNNIPVVYRGGVLQCRYLGCPRPRTALSSFGAFLNATRSPSMRTCVLWTLTWVPYGAFDQFALHEALANTSTINLRYWIDFGEVLRSRRQEDR